MAACSCIAHDALEPLVHHPRLRLFLDGVTAAVLGLIAATTVHLARSAITGLRGLVIFAGALAILYRWPPKVAVPLSSRAQRLRDCCCFAEGTHRDARVPVIHSVP